jgi:hypothetical protein
MNGQQKKFVEHYSNLTLKIGRLIELQAAMNAEAPGERNALSFVATHGIDQGLNSNEQVKIIEIVDHYRGAAVSSLLLSREQRQTLYTKFL